MKSSSKLFLAIGLGVIAVLMVSSFEMDMIFKFTSILFIICGTITLTLALSKRNPRKEALKSYEELF